MSKGNRSKGYRYWDKTTRINKLIEDGYEVDTNGRLVHRLVCEQAHGRFPKDWVVHHVDEDKKNNTPENLIAMPRTMHDHIHHTMRKESFRFTREQLSCMINGYIGLSHPKKPKLKIEINVTVCMDQSVKREPKVTVALRDMNKTISSLYR